jgi:hypothetical protein
MIIQSYLEINKAEELDDCTMFFFFGISRLGPSAKRYSALTI